MIKITSYIALTVLTYFGLPVFANGFGEVSGFAIFLLPFLQLKYKMSSKKSSKLTNQPANWHRLFRISRSSDIYYEKN